MTVHTGNPDAGAPFSHERVVVARGERSRLTIIVAVHSTALGPALGGCRLWSYPSWDDALHDALRLSEGMTAKNAVAGLARGGGKAVIHVPSGVALDPGRREAALLDLGDLVESLGGSYITAEDVGTTSEGMSIVATRTSHVVGLPERFGGQGDPGRWTARGVESALDATLAEIGLDSIAGVRITIVGLGQVGGSLAETLALRGAHLTLSDINPARRELATRLGAAWTSPETAHRVPADIFMPAGVGGMLTSTVIDELDCRAVVGPANNQLASGDGDARIAGRGILYAPDFVVNAGGVLHLASDGEVEAIHRIDGIGQVLSEIYARARSTDSTPLVAASHLVQARLLTAARTAVPA